MGNLWRVALNGFLWLGPILVIAIAVTFFLKVDLEPKLSPDFFFSADSEIYQQDRAIARKFPFQQQLFLNVKTAGSIADPNYLEKISIISGRLSSVSGITEVHSITNGPEDLEAARTNPLWQRLLIGNQEQSSFIIAYIGTEDFETLVPQVETIVREEENKWFEIHISGLPYIVEKIRENLSADMKTFTLGAIALCSLVVFLVYRSVLVVLGALIACSCAAMLSLIIQSFMGIPIGILTANLGAIIFVLTQTHVIFLVANWHNSVTKDDPHGRLAETLGHTFPASLWAGITTLLGFASLIFAEAKPLYELGVGGAIGTACALLCAYTIFPLFLKLGKVDPSTFTYSLARRFPLRRRVAVTLTLITMCAAGLIGLSGLKKINTDPSLLSYFDQQSELYNGLYYIDDNGGSNPLTLVVRRADGGRLDNSSSYDQMWELQQALAAHPQVGAVISLPVLMAEGNENWLGKLLPWNILLNYLSKPEYGSVAKSFISDDRTEALYLLKMNESERTTDRISIINELKAMPGAHGFELSMIGGTYYLQGELASSVRKSMTAGILTLIGLFGVIALMVTSSFMATIGVLICVICIAGLVIGTVGLLNIPVDIISSPAINICLGLIVDDMIHLSIHVKRLAMKAGTKSMRGWAHWKDGLNSQSWPALVSTIAIMIGFSVFGFSDFPPSRRFGLEIVYGAFLAVILALGVFPFIASFKFKHPLKDV